MRDWKRLAANFAAYAQSESVRAQFVIWLFFSIFSIVGAAKVRWMDLIVLLIVGHFLTSLEFEVLRRPFSFTLPGHRRILAPLFLFLGFVASLPLWLTRPSERRTFVLLDFVPFAIPQIRRSLPFPSRSAR